MRLSGRMRSGDVADAAAWATHYRARKMREAGEPVLDLTIGEHDWPTDRSILRAMHESAMSGKTGYADVSGIRPLREALARRVEKSTGVPTGPDQVLVTNGGQAALLAAHMAVLDLGDRAALIDPFYPTYPGTILAAGGRLAIAPAPASGGFLPERDRLEAATAGSRSLLINSPNNPTGAKYPRRALQAIADAAARNDLWVISDEVYEAQVWDGEHLSIRQLDGMARRTIVIGSMSKSFAMTGSRIGWLSGPAEAVEAAREIMAVMSFGVSEFVQDAALHALRKGPEFEAEIAAPFKERRGAVLEALSGLPLIRATPSGGGMYVLLDIRATGVGDAEFARGLLDQERIAVMPGGSFGREASGHVRIALTASVATLQDAVSRISEFAARAAGIAGDAKSGLPDPLHRVDRTPRRK